MSSTVQRRYCPSCGEEVDTYVILDAGVEQLHCFICGAALTGEAGPGFKPLPFMLVAEDSRVFREVLKDKVLELGMAEEVELAEQGERFITLFTHRVSQGQPVSLAVLDIQMPIMDGIHAGLALRAVERGLKKQRPTPILFFASVRCDEDMRVLFTRCAPE
jgi:CheY-like chemotaxis protein